MYSADGCDGCCPAKAYEEEEEDDDDDDKAEAAFEFIIIIEFVEVEG